MLNAADKNRLAGLDKLANGLYYGYLPKVGDNGLVIFTNRRAENWKFNLPKGILPEGDYWFQVYTPNTGWEWSHGIVNNRGKITQIG